MRISIPALLATVALGLPTVMADSNATGGGIVASETLSLGFGPFGHAGDLGDVDNSITTATFTGGFSATHLSFSGTLQNNIGASWGSEADIFVSDPFDFLPATTWQNPLPSSTFTGPVDYSGSTALSSSFDPGGTWNVEFFESFDDGAGVDSFSENVSMTFEEREAISDTDGVFSLGNLAVGETVSEGEFALSGLIDTYDFTLASDGVFSAETNFKNVFTGASVDTMLALFDASGNPLAFNDDGGAGLYSLIGGVNLTAGDYTLLVSSYNGANDASTPLSSWTPGNGTGDYGLVLTFVPEPSGTLLIGLLGLTGLATRRRQRG